MNENEYIVNAFTRKEENTNLEVDHFNVSCITSKSNNFELDREGNLTVKSITTTKKITPNQDVIDLIYPAGSIYMSVNNLNPEVLFGGTWETWGVGRVPVGVDQSDSLFNVVEKTGGSKYLQKHTHEGVFIDSTEIRWSGNGGGAINLENIPNVFNASVTDNSFLHTGEAGNGNSENLPPYITCYMWKRVS